MIRPMSALRRLGIVVAAGACALVLGNPAPAVAQDTGVIVGTVTESGSGRPLESAQVFIQGSSIGALTNAAGRYLLTGVPTGTHTLRVQLVGYKEATQTVTVSSGESVVADIAIQQTAIELDEIVVTGAGVATEKRRLGNTIATIDVASAVENAPIADFSQLIGGREAGLVGLPSSGVTGEGARIRIRGSASLSQNNEPIIYVDGIRVDDSGGFGPNVSAGGQGSPSRLDDIPPEAIERIEVLKGAAAATLYGTEASNGVIQIFTKRGVQGTPRWTFQTDQTVISTPTSRMIPMADFARDADDVARIQSRWGMSLQPFEVFEQNILPEFFETGYGQAYSGSVSGGGDLITYFVSGRYTHENGPFGLNEDDPQQDINEKVQATANLNIFPAEDLRVRVSGLYTEATQETPSNSNNIFGSFSSAMMAQIRKANENDRFGAPAFGTSEEFLNEQIEQSSTHFAGSVNANWTLAEGFVLDGTFGVDISNQETFDFFPFGWNINDFATFRTEGARFIGDRNHREVTGDFKGSWQTDINESLDSQLIFGAQGFINQTTTRGGDGLDFPGPGLEVATAGATQTLFETFIRNVNAGFYAQEQVGFNDYVFLTVGGRWDANSAFGENFEGQFYPKASASVVLSDMGNWENETISTLRVRGAIGQSGLQPSAFDKFTTFAALPTVDGPGIQPSNLGNQELKPEVATEWEIGAEVGFLNDRFALDMTYWNRKVKDALVSRQFPVTGGFRAQQLDNIGEIQASGVEISVNGSLLQNENFTLDFFANGAYIQEEVTDMGGAPPLKTGGSYPRYRNFIKEGAAPGAYFGAKIDGSMAIPLDVGPTACAEPTQAEAEAFFSDPDNFSLSAFEVIPINCGGAFLDTPLGKPTPDWQGSFGFNSSIFSNWELNTLFEYKAGHYNVQDLSGAFRQANSVIGRNTPDAARVNSIVSNPATSPAEKVAAAVEWAQNIRALSPMSGMNQIWNADWVRFRELSLTYRVPSDWVNQFRMNTLSLSFGVRNLAWLYLNDDYRGLDPEVNIVGRCDSGITCNFLLATEGWGQPIGRRFTFSAKVGL